MGTPAEQMPGAVKNTAGTPAGDGWPRPILHADDTLESFITRHAEAIADTARFSAPVRKAFIERSLSLGIRSWDSPDEGQTVVTYDEKALKSIKEEQLGRDYEIKRLDDWKFSDAYWDNIRSAQEDPAAFVKETAAYVRNAEARALMRPGLTAAESDVHAFSEKLRQSGFHKIAIDNAGEMFEAYNNMYANLGRKAEFHQYADSLSEKITLAAQQGVVSDRTRDNVLKEVEGLKKTYRIWTPEETAAYEQKRTQGMQPYQDLLTEMEYLRDSFAKRGNTSLGAGALPYHMAMDMIRKVDGLEKIVTEGTPGAAKAFISANGLEKWQKNPGSLTEYADRLTASDEWHFGFFKRAHSLMEASNWPPAVAAAKIMDNVLEGNRKGLSDKQITFNIGVDLVSELAVKKLTGGLGKPGGTTLDLASETGLKKLTGGAAELGKEVMGEFVRVSATEFLKDPTRDNLGKSLGQGFYEAVTTKIPADALKKLPDVERRALKEFILEAGSKFGAIEGFKPAMERLFSPPSKQQSSNVEAPSIPNPKTVETPGFKSLLASAEKLSRPEGVTAERVAITALDVSRKEGFDAKEVYQGSRDPNALTAVNAERNLRSSVFTFEDVKRMDTTATLVSLDQRDPSQQQDAATVERNAKTVA